MISTGTLADALDLLASIAERDKHNHILGHVLLSASAGWLRATATNLTVTAHRVLPFEGSLEPVCVDARTLREVVASAPGEAVGMANLPNGWLAVTSGSASHKLPGVPADHFPKVPRPEPDKAQHLANVPSSRLAVLVGRGGYACSKDETRPHLAGGLLTARGGALGLVSTDGHRLVRSTARGDLGGRVEYEAIIPRKGLQAIARLDGDVTLAHDHEHLFAVDAGADGYIAVRVIDAKFPPIDQVIPKHASHVDINREALIGAIKRVGIVAGGRALTLDLGDTVRISAANPEKGESAEVLTVEESDGPGVHVGVNPRYLLDALEATDAEVVGIRYAGELDPLLLEVDSGEAVIMPMRVA